MIADRFPTRTIFEKSRPGVRAAALPLADFPSPAAEELPARYRRAAPARLPSVSEPEIVRHFTRMSKRNFDLDSGFYPLGSCTMKHPPKLRERVLSLDGHAALHPLQDPARAQGALELMWKVERALAEITGLPHVCLQPAAGAQGELAGLLLTRAYHAARGDRRTVVLTPQTAHGTNPATITMAGHELVTIAVSADGDMDLDDLRAKLSSDVACLMLTNPSTLGLFERNIEAIRDLVNDAGATLYYDGANLNAIMGICRPGDMGFDIVHLNLHKSFGQPHGGGGPGAGPIAVGDRLAAYLPNPRIVRRDDHRADAVYDLSDAAPASIGRLRGFFGPYAVAASAYAYIRLLGGAGLRDASETAVLNANYLLARLTTLGVTEYLPAAYDRTCMHVRSYDRTCMHEFVLSGVPMRRRLGISTLDLAKRLLDYGFHPPTIYFPLLVDEALLIEPTETETKETLDAFAAAIAAILQEAAGDPTIAQTAPHTTPVGRLDEVRAARELTVTQRW
jgi:glycine dehydrogenase subunit 2